MKSEERHELETNSLAKWIDRANEKVGPYASHIIYGILVVVAIWAVVRLSTGTMKTKRLEAWNSYIGATLPGRIDEQGVLTAAETYEGQPVGELAEIAWADCQLTQGTQYYFIDKERANESLDAALSTYKGLAMSADDKILRQRAQLGVARTLEAQCEFDKAIEAYKEITGAFADLAEVRIEQLEDYDAEQAATWLASAEGARRRPGSDFRRPDFTPESLNLPGGDPATGGVDGGEDFLEMLRRMQESTPDAPEDSGDDNPMADRDAEFPDLVIPSADETDSTDLSNDVIEVVPGSEEASTPAGDETPADDSASDVSSEVETAEEEVSEEEPSSEQ